MCDFCDDELTNIPSGPAGPTGATGPAGATPVLSGTSTSSVLIATGTKVFTTQSGIAWVQGQRLRVVDSTNLNLMEGEVASYTGTTLTLNVDYIEGAGTISSWTISITGSRGSIGATGANGSTGGNGNNSFGKTTGVAISLGANLYTLPMANNNSQWGVIGQVIYVETAGYYKITAITAGTSFQVLDLLYAGNIPANMTGTSGLNVGPGGIIGATGATGGTGSTGPTGATGATGPGFSMINIKTTNTPIPSATSITLIGGAAQTGIIIYSLTAYLKSDTGLFTTCEIKNNAVGSGYKSITTGSSPVSGLTYVQIAITGVLTVTSGDIVTLDIALNDYTQNASIAFLSMNYYYR